MRRAAGSVLAVILMAGSAPPKAHAQVMHASGALIALAEEFRSFRSPVFRPRTWRPTHASRGVPDYAAVVRAEREGLPRFQARLAALDPRRWPVHDQVDYLLLRAEMDDVDFEHRVLREPATNPSFYVEQAIDGVAAAVRGTVPYTLDRAEAIVSAFERTGPILQQGPRTLVLAEASADLGRVALRHLKNIRAKYAAGAKLFAPHVPESHRARLVAAADAAATALETYGRWVESSLPAMKGKPNVGREAMEWYFRRVNFVPWTADELLSLGEVEKNRFLMSIEIEETRNRGLKPLTMPTTDEWIEWFRLTYLQTKHWLKDLDLISFPPYVGESSLARGTWQEPFGGIGNRPGLLGFFAEAPPQPSKRLFVVDEDHWFAGTYWERAMRLDPITDYQHSDWPGHYFEGEVTRRNPCPIRAVHRDTGFSQGWAHYWEEFFLDMGYPYLRGPRTRELTYNFLLLRAVRVPLDIRLSDGTLTMEDAIKYQIDRVPTMEDHISRSEVELYVRWPYQATSYIAGKKQIEQILAERIAQNNFEVNWREFHDAMLSYGQIPPALVRWEMTGQDDQIRSFWDAPARARSDRRP
ncbi:MAG: DUF885 family protein [Acidobacteria bacterium]|nr:DUF885 family protein [Acidobacteriota bacterium]